MKKPLFNLTDTRRPGDQSYDGYANSSTAIFKLYLDNNREWHEKCVSLRENPTELTEYLQKIPLKLDNSCEGRVWLLEIVAEICLKEK